MQVVILGTSTNAVILARRLSRAHDIIIIGEDASETVEYYKLDAHPVDGVIIDRSVLEEAGIADADVVCALSPSENTNLVAAQIALHFFNVKKVIACVYDTEEFEMFKDVGVIPISATDLTVDAFIEKIKSDEEDKASNSIGVQGVNLFGDEFNFKMFRVDERLEGTKLKNISDTEGGVVLGVLRDGTLFNFDPSFRLKYNDKIIVAEVFE